MNQRMTMAELANLGGLANLRSSASGNPLRAIAEAAVSAQGKAQDVPKVAKEGYDKGAVSQEAKKRFVIGVDPGVKTGFAVWDRESGKFVTIETRDFWGVMLPLICDTENLLPHAIIRNTTAEFIVEVAHYAPTFIQRREKATSIGTADRMSRNVGGVTREAQLIVSGLRACGYTVIETKPLGKAKKAADDVRDFERLTGWTKQTSQHARDAARLCFQM